MCELEAADIPYFVVGQHFGGLYPGPQVAFYNEKSIQVPKTYFAQAQELVEEFGSNYEPTGTNLATKSKLRLILEFLLIGWFAPGGSKTSNK